MSHDASFAELMRRLREHDDEAETLIWRRFSYRLAALAKSRLGRLISRTVDPEDVMLSAFFSFFHRNRQGQFDLGTWDELWTLLTLITLRKCGYHIRFGFQACRDERRNVALPHDDEEAAAWELIAREPTPEEAAVHAETVEQAFRGLTPSGRLVLQLALQGYTVAEISERVKVCKSTVYRNLAEIQKRLERQNGRHDPGA
jgi:RNA polymerase sigma-70 factor (ECF subfamily)